MYRWDRWTGGQIFVAFSLHTTMVTRLTAFIVTYTSTTMSLRWESLSCCHDNTKVILPWLQLLWAVQLTHCWKENDIILQPVNMCGWDCYVWVAQGSTHKVGERTYSAFSSLFLLCPPPMTAWRSLESAHQRSVPTTRSYLLHWPMEEGNKSEVAMTSIRGWSGMPRTHQSQHAQHLHSYCKDIQYQLPLHVLCSHISLPNNHK